MSYITNSLQRFKLLPLLLILGLTLAACGETTAPRPTESATISEWDNTKWNESTWD